MSKRVRIAGVATYLPHRTMTTDEVERRLVAGSPDWPVLTGWIERLTGVRRRHVADDSENASDLAAAAAAKVLASVGRTTDDVDLLIFASASQDMVEPATAHITSATLGTRCPVFDVKDACNSFINGLQVADALIRTGRYRRVLVVTGETPSRAVRWRLTSKAQFIESLPGYTLSDGGAAMLLEGHDGSPAGIDYLRFQADSTAWQVGTLPGGGSAHPHEPDAGYFRFDVTHLKAAFAAVGPGLFLDGLAALGLTWADFALVGVHQVALNHLDEVARRCAIPSHLLEVTVADHGNLASASLPLQLARAIETGRCGPGDRVALLGLAGGISLGMVVATL